MNPSLSAPPLLQMRGIDKSFPGVRALRGVDLTLERGEVLALLGENGAGKSTLIKTLSGAHQPDRGEILCDGTPLRIDSPHAAQEAGIGVIYQEFNLIPALSAAANIFLGKEATRAGLIARQYELQRARELFQRLGVQIDPATPCRQLTVAQQQIVEIAKALLLDARIIVMDEPTAALTSQEVSRLFDVIGELKSRGIGVIYISHRLDEIYRIADRVCVLRDGACVGERAIGAVARDDLIELMVGRQLRDEFPPRDVTPGAVRFEVSRLSRGAAVRDVSFCVRAGEVLAVTGLVGAGRTQTARLIFGADARSGGEIRLDGRQLAIRSPRDAIAAGIALLTEDRKSQGLILQHPVRTNFGLPNLDWLSRYGWLKRLEERQALEAYVISMRIKLSSQDQPAGTLSGGNQQKIVLAKWLAGSCEVLIFDEPTRGIDVGAKYEIYRLINQLANQGKCIIMISSEMPEVLGMADRILVMHEGRVTGEIDDVAAATQEQIMELAVS